MSDVEKNAAIHGAEKSDSSLEAPPREGGFWKRFYDGFKPVNMAKINTEGMTQDEIAAVLTANQPLKRDLNKRILIMLAIGGSIGTGLFIGSAGSFQNGGPGGVVIGYFLVGLMLFSTMNTLGELAVRYPVSGSFAVFSSRFLDPSWGFAMGWNYGIQWLVVYPLELIAGALVIGYWDTDNNSATRVNKAAWVALFWFAIGFINIFGVRGFGEAEFIFSLIKVLAVIGFCIFGIIQAAGGPPTNKYLGTHYWYDPGSFPNGFKGVVAVFVNAAFAFAGTELSGLAAAETDNPAKALPRAVKQVFWRVCLFYIVSLTIVACLVPYDDPQYNPTFEGQKDGRISPFVIAIQNSGVHALPSIFNTVIIISVLSVANSSVYGCSRTFCALGACGQAPRIFSYIDREGRPLVAVCFTLIFGLLCFLAASDKQAEVFDWLLALSGLSSIFTWGSINLAHIRFRRGMSVQGRSLDEMAYTCPGGWYTAWVGFGINVAILGLQFWIAVWPLNDDSTGGARAQSFFKAYLSVPIVLAFWLGHKAWFRTGLYIRAKDMDLDTGMRNLNMEQVKAEIREEKERVAQKNIFFRTYRFWC